VFKRISASQSVQFFDNKLKNGCQQSSKESQELTRTVKLGLNGTIKFQ
jgi:hypothetical protein